MTTIPESIMREAQAAYHSAWNDEGSASQSDIYLAIARALQAAEERGAAKVREEYGTEEKPRYTTKRLRLEIARAEERGRQEERETWLSADGRFQPGQFVGKKSGSWWEGRVVGFYSTEQTPIGYAVQLDKPNGPVQLYPESALEAITKDHGNGN